VALCNLPPDLPEGIYRRSPRPIFAACSNGECRMQHVVTRHANPSHVDSVDGTISGPIAPVVGIARTQRVTTSNA